jgi:OmcA/MtrC family decaheme c-type cytochrome
MGYLFILMAAMALAAPPAYAKDKTMTRVVGKVTDSVTGKKIKGATVLVTGDAIEPLECITNKKGKCKVKVKKGNTYMVEISYPDYLTETREVSVTAKTKVLVALVPTSSVPKSAYDIAVENGYTGTEEEWVMELLGVGPEVCSYCHDGGVARNGSSHQEQYDELFQQDVVEVSNVAYSNDGSNDIVTFEMSKNGAAFDCTELNSANPDGSGNSLNIRFSQYDAATRSFSSIDTSSPPDGTIDLLSIKGTITYDAGTNICTSTNPVSALGDLNNVDGVIAVYGENEIVDTIAAAHINLGRFPFAALLQTGPAGVDYESLANATGCENCHTTPYYKHGYIKGDVSNGGGQDFYACKVCHVDNRDGGHIDWQVAVDNPQRWAELWNGDDPTAAEEAQYAYKTRLMNDVHMSHSMEFPYPQPIRTCATCHEGKLEQTLSDDNFALETCLSCHPVTGGTDTANEDGEFAVDTRDMALKTIWEEDGVSRIHVDDNGDIRTNVACNFCHREEVNGGIAPVFSALHTGYDPLIYYQDTDGQYKHYRDAITASIDSVTLSDNMLDIRFSATGTAGELSADDVVPTVQVSFYGYDSKDFILSNHTRNSARERMEKTMGTDNPLFTEVTNEPGNWEVTLDLAAYAKDPADFDIVANIASGVIKQAEVMVRPSLDHPTITTVDRSGNTVPAVVGLNAVSKTVEVTADGTNMYVADYFQGDSALVKVEKVVDPFTDSKSGCNSCHDQLAITFHSGDRGGNIVVCRSCHVVTSGGSHLEGQSRSIDSYVHAIHRFQAFDVDEIDFTDPVEEARYEEHTEFLFPDFATINCERCHTETRAVDNGMRGTFDIPYQSFSMPGFLSATDESPGISSTPEVIVGPAARACGGCHRAAFINEGDNDGYVTFNEHTKLFGYRVEGDDDLLYAIISYIMGLFQ